MYQQVGKAVKIFCQLLLLVSHLVQCQLPIILNEFALINQNNGTAPGLSTCDEECQASQRKGLRLLYDSTGGDYWHQSQGWNDNDDYCTWYGVYCCTDQLTIGVRYMTIKYEVTVNQNQNVKYDNEPQSLSCNKARSVAAVILPLNNLTGSLVGDVFNDLNTLMYLDFLGNHISGGFPSELASDIDVRVISVARNELSGMIPSTIGFLSNVEYIDLSFNNLTGSIPFTMSDLGNLKYLNLAHNNLQGTLSKHLYWLGAKKLRYLNLEFNNFAGSLEDYSGSFLDTDIPYIIRDNIFEEISFRSNKLTGKIPESIFFIPVEVLDLGQNQFTGEIPVTIGRSPFRKKLYLDNNKLTGSIPKNLTQWGIEEIDFSRNQLVGELPEILGEILTIRKMIFAGNNITGEVPPSYQQLPLVKTMDFSETKMRAKSLNSKNEFLPEYCTFSIPDDDTQKEKKIIVEEEEPAGEHLQADEKNSPERRISGYQESYQQGFKCQSVVGVDQHVDLQILLSPEYYYYQSCTCDKGKAPNTAMQKVAKRIQEQFDQAKAKSQNNEGVQVYGQIYDNLECYVVNQARFYAVLLSIIAVILCLPLIMWVWFRYRMSLARFQMTLVKRKGPPGKNREVTLVLTDIEGSTELWEWNTEIMSEAIDMHDRMLRSQMAKFYGYEVTTEGDAFLVAFHEPADAVAWCLATQQALLGARWPSELLQQPKSGIVTVDFAEKAYQRRQEAERIAKEEQDAAQDEDGEQTPPGGPHQDRVSSVAHRASGDVSSVSQAAGHASQQPARGSIHSGSFNLPRPANQRQQRGSLLQQADHELVGDEHTWDQVWKQKQQAADKHGTANSKHGKQSLTSHARSSQSFDSQSPIIAKSSQGIPAIKAEYDIEVGGSFPEKESLLSQQNLAKRSQQQGSLDDNQVIYRQNSLLQTLLSSENDFQAFSVDELEELSKNQSQIVSKLFDQQQGIAWGNHQLMQGYYSYGVIFRGLRVRMGLATGMPESMRVHKLTMRAEYFGDVVRRAQAVSDTPHGGQVIMDAETFKIINSRLDELAQMLSLAAPETATGRQNSTMPQPLNKMAIGESKISKGTRPPNTAVPVAESTTRRSAATRVASQAMMQQRQANIPEPQIDYSHFDKPQQKSPRIGDQFFQFFGKGQKIIGKKLGINEDDDFEDELNQGLGGTTTNNNRRQQMTSPIMVVDMGIHKLKGLSEPNNLVQALAPGLEDRARYFNDLCSVNQLSPGYLDAPGSRCAALRKIKFSTINVDLPQVTLIFCAIDRYSEMAACDKVASEEALMIYNDCIRRTLIYMNGYECQELEGAFMIAFDQPSNALEWALLIQEIFLGIDWSDDVMRLPGAEKQSSQSGAIMFRGPKVKVGIYQGTPTKICPHTTTGRADYFGQLVNRAARYCHGASHGGQVLIDSHCVDDLVEQWATLNPAEIIKPALVMARYAATPFESKWGARDTAQDDWQPNRDDFDGDDDDSLLTDDEEYESQAGSQQSDMPQSSTAAQSNEECSQSEHYSNNDESESQKAAGRAVGEGSSQNQIDTKLKEPMLQSYDQNSQQHDKIKYWEDRQDSGLDTQLYDPEELSQQDQAAGSYSQQQDDNDEDGDFYLDSYDDDDDDDGTLTNFMSMETMQTRLGNVRWVWSLGMQVEDLGKFTFKGVSGVHQICSVKSRRLKDREFPQELRKGKGERVETGAGVSYQIVFNPPGFFEKLQEIVGNNVMFNIFEDLDVTSPEPFSNLVARLKAHTLRLQAEGNQPGEVVMASSSLPFDSFKKDPFQIEQGQPSNTGSDLENQNAMTAENGQAAEGKKRMNAPDSVSPLERSSKDFRSSIRANRPKDDNTVYSINNTQVTQSDNSIHTTVGGEHVSQLAQLICDDVSDQ